jgi:hypothetical protein
MMLANFYVSTCLHVDPYGNARHAKQVWKHTIGAILIGVCLVFGYLA